MARALSNQKLLDALLGIALAAAVLALVVYPSQAVEAARSGWELCCNVIIPSLFPFFVLSSLCVELGLVRYLSRAMEGVMRPLFGVGGACASAFVLGIVGGYPVGARTAIELYEKKYISKPEAQKLLAFCNNSGPAFILGVAGAGVFGSSQAGLLLYAAHIASSVLVGMLFRGYGGRTGAARRSAPVRQTAEPGKPFADAFPACVKGAFFSTLSICGFVTFFTVVIRMLFVTGLMTLAARGLAAALGFLGMTPDWAEKLLIGAIEMSSGVWSLSGAAGSLPGKLSMAAFILGWAGLSVHCQVLSFIGQTGLRARTYFLGKLLHGCVSAALVWVLTRIWPLREPVSSYLAREVTGLAGLEFSSALRASALAAAAAGAGIGVICLAAAIKDASQRRKTVV